MSTAVVSGADSAYFDLLLGAVRSVLNTQGLAKSVDAVVLDFGLDAGQCDYLRSIGAKVLAATVPPGLEHLVNGLRVIDRALLLRAFLPELLPHYDTLVWLDSDAWVQDEWALARYIEDAARADVVVGKERHPTYAFQPRLRLWEWRHLVKAFGMLKGSRLALRDHINAGVFAARTKSPLWGVWQSELLEIFGRIGKVAPYDQMVLNYCVYGAGLSASILDARYNWICKRRLPVWDASRSTLAVPGARQPNPIGIVHLAGVGKDAEVEMLSTEGTRQRGSLRFPDRASA